MASHQRSPLFCRPFLLVLGFALLFSGPVMATVAEAQAIPIQAQATEEPEGPIRTLPTQEPPIRVSPTEEPAEEPLPERIPPEEPATEPPAAEPEPVLPRVLAGTMTIRKGVCDDPAVDFHDPELLGDIDNFLDHGACGPPEGEFEFTFDFGGEPISGFTILGVLEGNIPTGEVTITETLPDGWGEPVVFCASDQAGAGSGSVGASVMWNVGLDEQVECWFFNIADPEEYVGDSLYLNKYACPLGYDASSPTYDDIASECSSRVSGVPFEVSGIGSSSSQFYPLEFKDIPAGQVTIVETVPAQYDVPVVFCYDAIPGQQDATPPEPMNVTGGAITWDFQAGGYLVCDWFNILGDQNAGKATIQKHTCPDGIDISMPDRNSLLAACTGDLDGVIFDASGSGGFAANQATGDAIPSAVEFDDLPHGQVTITETIPAGYGVPVVFCDDAEFGEHQQKMVTGGSIDLNLLVGEQVTCDWLNIPVHENTVTVNKRICPPGLDLSKAELGLACDPGGDGIEFTFVDGAGTHPKQVSGAQVEWTGVVIGQEGELQIIETIPDGYGDPIVYCGEAGGTLEVVESTNGFVLPVPGPDDPFHIICTWYNMPEEDGNSVTVHTWLCPAGFDETVDDPGVHCTETMDGVTYTLDGLEATTGEVIPGAAVFTDVSAGYNSLYQISSISFNREFTSGCILNGQPPAVPPLDPNPPVMLIQVGEGTHWVCHWYNVPDDGNSVTVIKWRCPEGTTYNQGFDWYDDNCTVPMDNVTFTVTSEMGVEVQQTVGGVIAVTGLPDGDIGIQETIPAGYGEPVTHCDFGSVLGFQSYDTPTGYIGFSFDEDDGDYATCIFYNIPGERPDLTILKWTCPEGYDLFAAGADPYTDCTEATNGIGFELRYEGHDDVEEAQTAGDAIPGGVFFDDLQPDSYNVTELVPEGIGKVFVLECTGHIMGVLQPYPLQMGAVLDEIDLDAGEHLVCHYFNVPEPEGGSIVVTKYTCQTEIFVSEVECQIYEHGATFDLLRWNVVDGIWEAIDTQVTDGVGQISWLELEAGDYGLQEHGGAWCELTTIPVFGPGDFFTLFEGEETLVKVYNCDGVPGEPGKTPTKYPDTGVGPDQSGPLQELPAFAPLVGLLALFAARRRPQVVGKDSRVLPLTRPSAVSTRAGTWSLASSGGAYEQRETETPMPRTISRRRLAAALALPLGGTALIRSGIFAQGEQVIEPTDGTPTEGTPASLCLVATPDAATPVDGSDCFRGAVPAELAIASIGVEAPVEILETVGGVMQQPSDENHVAWYKETARLGEIGNILIAGHLNWWGVPEAVFFNLGTLAEGDEVVVLDEEGEAWTYAVEWVRQESNLEPPSEEVLGMTDYEAVTLITCGGEWDNSISEYDERTVARARRIADSGTPEAV